MSIELEKSKLRKHFKEQRALLSREEVAKRSQRINQNFIQNLLPQIYHKNSAKIFSIYSSSYNEVSTAELADYFKKNRIKFSYPKIIEQNQPLEFVLAADNQTFAPNKFFPTLSEPISGEHVFPDFVILPILSFDRTLSRLGMGGGFFDRTIELLKKQNHKIITIGLAYEFQRAGEILPTEKTDQRLDFIVTEKMIFSAS